MLKGLPAILIAAFLGILTSLAFNISGLFFSPNWWWSIVFYLVVFTAIMVINNARSSAQAASDKLIGTITVKMLLLFISIFFYSLIDKKGLFHFSMHFIAHYILFTVSEIRYLLSKLKKEQIKK